MSEKWKRIDHVPAVGTKVRVTLDGNYYTGTVLCTPYDMRGETHFAIASKGMTPVFCLEDVTIEVEG